MLLEKTLESPLHCKEIQPVHPKGDQSWIFIGRTDADTEAPILWAPDAKNWLFGIRPNAGQDWRWEEKGTTEDEMVGWHHQLDGHEFEQAPGVDDGQESLACCTLWGRKVSDTTEWLNWKKTRYSKLLPSPSLLSLLHDRTINHEMRCWGVGKLADKEYGRQMSQNNHLIGVWLPGSFIKQRVMEMRK